LQLHHGKLSQRPAEESLYLVGLVPRASCPCLRLRRAKIHVIDSEIVAGSGTVTPCANAGEFTTVGSYDALKFAARSMKSLMIAAKTDDDGAARSGEYTLTARNAPGSAGKLKSSP